MQNFRVEMAGDFLPIQDFPSHGGKPLAAHLCAITSRLHGFQPVPAPGPQAHSLVWELTHWESCAQPQAFT